MTIINSIKRLFVYPIKYSKSGQYKMVLIVRSDISMGRGKIGSQCAHAAVECYRQVTADAKYQSIRDCWLMQGQPKIVLRISDEESLLKLARDARKVGLIISVLRDAGRTQLQPGTITTLGIGPGPQEQINDLTSNLKLL